MTSEITEEMVARVRLASVIEAINEFGIEACAPSDIRALEAALVARPAPEAGSVAVKDDGTAFDPYDLIQSQAAQIASLSAKVAEVERERDREGLRAEEQWAGWVKADVAKRNAEARAERLEKALRIIGHTGNRGIGIALGAPAIDNKFQTDGEVARAALQQEGESDE